jgi:hypothetical protein
LLPSDEPLDPNEHKSLLSKYILVAPIFVPQDKDLCTPTLRHPDLSLSNVFLVPNSTKTLGFIDWQDAAILTIVYAGGLPGVFVDTT